MKNIGRRFPGIRRVAIKKKVIPQEILEKISKEKKSLTEVLKLIIGPGNYILSHEEIGNLIKLKLTNGELIFDLDKNNSFTYEMIGQVYTAGYDKLYKYLTSKKWEHRKDIFFDSPELETSRRKSLIDMQNFRKEIIAIKGIYTCRNCGSKETVGMLKTITSGDEPFRTDVTCQMCDTRWVV